MNKSLKNDILIQSIEHSNLAHTISRLDGDMELTYVNEAFLRDTGYERDEVVGRNCRFLQGEGTNPEHIQKIRDAIKNIESIDIEILNYKKSGEPFWNRLRMAPVFDDQEKPIAYIGIQTDVTHIRENLRLDAERQKLEALGRLTGNISHEIKNALQPVQLMAETLKDWKSLDEERIVRCIEILNDNIGVADRVVRDVLSFSRKPDDALEKIPVEDLKSEVFRFTKNLLHSRVTFSENIEDYPHEHEGYVEIRENQLFQILMNLVSNALYAMEDKGMLTLRWSYEELKTEHSVELGVASGPYLCIGVTDTGCGMDDKTIKSAFDPFYSTKPPGEGTGLGLSISYRIVKEWDGTINIQSQMDKGSAFTIYLPLVK